MTEEKALKNKEAMFNEFMKIINAVLSFNGDTTNRQNTGFKPTILVELDSQYPLFQVRIFEKGWYPEADFDSYVIYFSSKLDETYSKPLMYAIKARERVFEIIKEWEERK